MSPTAASGALISTATMGSSTIALASRIAAKKALRPAVTKAISLLSTLWCLPSNTVTRTSTTGWPEIAPLSSTSRTPFSIAGMKLPGMVPPLTASTNSNPAPTPLDRGSGSTRR